VKRLLSSAWLSVAILLAAAILLILQPAADQGHGLSASFWDNDKFIGTPVLVKDVRRWEMSMDGNLASSDQSTFSIRWEGYLQIEQAGQYEFMLDSDDGSTLWLNGRRVVDNRGTHVRRQRHGSTQLDSGEHNIKLEYTQGVGNSFLSVSYKAPGMTDWHSIPLDILTPRPMQQFDSSLAKSANQGRLIVQMFLVLLLLAACIQFVFVRRARLRELLKDRSQRQAFFKRIAGSSITHDLVVVLICLGFYLQTIAARLPHEPYMKGDSPYYANTVISMLHDGDLDQRNQSDTSIFEKPKSWTNIGMYDSNLARGSRGEWYPKHTLILPFLSVPFYAALGGQGLLIFNVVILLLMLVVVRRVAWHFASPAAADVAAVAIGLTPLFHHFAYSYSADILAAVLIVGGVGALLSQRGLAAGFLLGLSVWVKIPNGIVLPLAFFLLLILKDYRTLFRFIFGCAVSLGIFAGFNWYQFGAPWITSYQRVWTIERGVSTIGDHVSSFDFPFWEGMRLQLVDSLHGLIPTAGAAVLAIFGYFSLFKKSRPAFFLILLFSAITFLFYCKYDFVTGSHYSNRFLMPVVALAAIPLACLLDALFRKKSEL
jgi:PA14 domain-containing protein/glycosyl transferase family 87